MNGAIFNDAFLQTLPAAALVGAEGFVFGFGGGWLALSHFVDKPVWVAVAIGSGAITGALAAVLLLRQAVRVARTTAGADSDHPDAADA